MCAFEICSGINLCATQLASNIFCHLIQVLAEFRVRVAQSNRILFQELCEVDLHVFHVSVELTRFIAQASCCSVQRLQLNLQIT